MPANTEPIYTLTPNVGFALINAQQANSGRGDGVGTLATDIFKAFTAGANGSFIKEARIKGVYLTTAAGGTGVATVIRAYLSTISSGTTTASDTHLISEIAIPALTALVSATASPSPDFILPLNFAIPTGMYLHVGSGAAMGTNCGWKVSIIGGDY